MRGSSRLNYGNSGPPGWLVFVFAVALVFGSYYVWLGVRNFVQTGGLGRVEATEQAVALVTATAERIQAQRDAITPLPSLTPIPECQDFVIVSSIRANLRQLPNTESGVIDTLAPGEVICVIELEVSGEWYLIDSNPRTRRIDVAYIHESIVEALNPTLTPSLTFTPLPTVTDIPTHTPTITPSPAPTDTLDPNATPTTTPTPSSTPTAPAQNA